MEVSNTWYWNVDTWVECPPYRSGLGPTCFGYFVQGWFKFGGVEFFKVQAAQRHGRCSEDRQLTHTTFSRLNSSNVPFTTNDKHV